MQPVYNTLLQKVKAKNLANFKYIAKINQVLEWLLLTSRVIIINSIKVWNRDCGLSFEAWINLSDRHQDETCGRMMSCLPCRSPYATV